MPLYGYRCARCGEFGAWRAMALAAAPAACPACAEPAPRTVAAPAIAGLPHARRCAHERNERGAHEPTTLVRKELPTADRAHGHRGAREPHRLSGLVGDAHHHVSRRPWTVGH